MLLANEQTGVFDEGAVDVGELLLNAGSPRASSTAATRSARAGTTICWRRRRRAAAGEKRVAEPQQGSPDAPRERHRGQRRESEAVFAVPAARRAVSRRRGVRRRGSQVQNRDSQGRRGGDARSPVRECPQPPRQGEAPANREAAADAGASLAFARRHRACSATSRSRWTPWTRRARSWGPVPRSPRRGGSGSQKVELGEWLLREGRGAWRRERPTARKRTPTARLTQAMDAAKRARVGLWRDWSPEAEAAAAAAAATAAAAAGRDAGSERARRRRRARRSSSHRGGAGRSAFLRAEGGRRGEGGLDIAAERPERPVTHSTSDESFRPKRGQTVAARFSGDDRWYRALVVEQAKAGDPAGVALVHFGDFGNGERLPAARLRAIDPSLAFHALPPLARACARSAASRRRAPTTPPTRRRASAISPAGARRPRVWTARAPRRPSPGTRRRRRSGW